MGEVLLVDQGMEGLPGRVPTMEIDQCREAGLYPDLPLILRESPLGLGQEVVRGLPLHQHVLTVSKWGITVQIVPNSGHLRPAISLLKTQLPLCCGLGSQRMSVGFPHRQVVVGRTPMASPGKTRS